MKNKLAVAKRIELAAPETLQEQVNSALQNVARALSQKQVSPQYLSEALAFLKDTSSAVEDLERAAKAHIERLLLEKGEQSTEKGSRVLEQDGLKFSMKPWRTGVDGKQLEKLIRAKDLDPAHYMDTKISYNVSELGIAKLISSKKMTRAEVDSCEYEPKWVVAQPVPVTDEE